MAEWCDCELCSEQAGPLGFVGFSDHGEMHMLSLFPCPGSCPMGACLAPVSPGSGMACDPPVRAVWRALMPGTSVGHSLKAPLSYICVQSVGPSLCAILCLAVCVPACQSVCLCAPACFSQVLSVCLVFILICLSGVYSHSSVCLSVDLFRSEQRYPVCRGVMCVSVTPKEAARRCVQYGLSWGGPS